MANASRGARKVHLNTKGKLVQLLHAHQAAFLTSLRALKDSPLSAGLAVLAIGIVLVLPLSGYLVYNQINHLYHQFDTGHELSAFLDGSIPEHKVEQLIAQLSQIEEVQSVLHQTPQSALEEFERKTDMGDLLKLLPSNPLPHVLIITPKSEYLSPDSMQALKATVAGFPEVDEVALDLDFIQKLAAINQVVIKIVTIVTFFIAVGCVVILSNIIRLSLERHRDEIQVYALMGATDAYIRRPFIYRAVTYGLMGAATAIALVFAGLSLLNEPMRGLEQLYQQVVYINSIPLTAVICLVFFSVLLSIISAKLAIWQYNE